MFYENLLKLCQEQGEEATPLLKKLDISTGGLANWRNGVTPGGKTLSKIADYFNVSVDYLLGRTDCRWTAQDYAEGVRDTVLVRVDADTDKWISYREEVLRVGTRQDYAALCAVIEAYINNIQQQEG